MDSSYERSARLPEVQQPLATLSYEEFGNGRRQSCCAIQLKESAAKLSVAPPHAILAGAVLTAVQHFTCARRAWFYSVGYTMTHDCTANFGDGACCHGLLRRLGFMADDRHTM
jgi:hypothetical protein